MSPGPVHFILTAGDLTPQYRRGLESAKVHGAPIWLHYTGERPDVPDYVELHKLEIPSWLEDEHPAHICDPLLLRILYEHGGMFLGMDTISLKPALDLLTKELCVSLDVPWEDYAGDKRHIDHPFSMHLLARDGSDLVHDLMVEAQYRVENWPASQKRWGFTGPALLTSYVLSNLDRVDVPPFPTLCGWEGSSIWRYYLGVEQPSHETRVIHLFSSAYPELYEGRAALWLERNPGFAEYRGFVPDWPYAVGNILPEQGEEDQPPKVVDVEPNAPNHEETARRGPTLHVVSLPWTATTDEYLTCAYTQKVVKFCRMMTARDHEVVLYAGEQNDAPAAEHVQILSEAERFEWFGKWGTEALFRKVTWDRTQRPWKVFNARCTGELAERVQPNDVVLITGGNCQLPVRDALQDLAPEALLVEPFVGYEGVFTHAAFESHAWRSHVYGLEGSRSGRWFDATIPNYFDVDEFPSVNDGESDYLLFVGRLVSRKGPKIAAQIAEAAGMRLVVAGPGMVEHGDDYIVTEEERIESRAGITYIGEVGVEDRAQLMTGARALLAPTHYIEPFGGVAVEAMMCGTPVIASDWGAFPETVTEGVSGFRFGVLREAVEAIYRLDELDNETIRAYALERYSLEAVAPQFERWFRRLDSLFRSGWDEIPAAEQAKIAV